MATAKSSGATSITSNSNQTGRNKDDLPTLKNKVAEVLKSVFFLFSFLIFFLIKLERQVTEYKTKLDELRRAKATTVVKLEKEYVNTAVPGFVFLSRILNIIIHFYFKFKST